MCNALFVCAVVAAITTPLPGQVVHLVQGGGAALQNVLNIAAPGDTLDVMPGTYTQATTTIGVHVALRPGAVVETLALNGTALTIHTLPAGQTFRLTGGMVAGFGALNCTGDVTVVGVGPAGITMAVTRVQGCTGAVLFDYVDFVVPTTPLVYGLVDIGSSAQVSFHRSRLPQMRIATSNVSLANVTVPPVYGFVPALHVVSGHVTIRGGAFTGGATASWPTAHPGLLLDQGEVVATDGTAFVASPAYWIFNTPAVVTNGGSLRLDPSVTFSGFVPITGPATVQFTEIPGLLATTGAQSLTVGTSGLPGSILVTFASVPRAPLATPWGDAWLLPTDPILDIVVLPAGGAASFTRQFATVPPHVTLVLQSVALTQQGTIELGVPTRVGWP